MSLLARAIASLGQNTNPAKEKEEKPQNHSPVNLAVLPPPYRDDLDGPLLPGPPVDRPPYLAARALAQQIPQVVLVLDPTARGALEEAPQ